MGQKDSTVIKKKKWKRQKLCPRGNKGQKRTPLVSTGKEAGHLGTTAVTEGHVWRGILKIPDSMEGRAAIFKNSQQVR